MTLNRDFHSPGMGFSIGTESPHARGVRRNMKIDHLSAQAREQNRDSEKQRRWGSFENCVCARDFHSLRLGFSVPTENTQTRGVRGKIKIEHFSA